ncbi:beta-galactosidase-like protein [Hungatella effluvii]|uniref:Beta-galactosidase-like protein n=2 Tax=Hungatella effluvii TaxID=1096246 RepID=A0A2V3Y1P4_9FIRM|nr:beta-galactosidase-like protein [Hungatella effluvii]
MIYMLKGVFAECVRDFVTKGGTFITIYWSGVVDETDLFYLGGIMGLLHDLLGMI